MFFTLSLLFINKSLSYLVEWSFLDLFGVTMECVFYLDWMSLMFMSFVLFISCLILNYSSEYMVEDKFLKRFIFLMVMFVMSMMMMILNLNLISILLGWDGLGLVSYALVVYYQNVKSNSAGMLTALSNRIGDAAIILSVAWMLHYGSFNFMFYISSIGSMNGAGVSIINYVTWLIILAAITKSAQIPFSSWLPAAMAAPTPVSSLVHSSTLVTAGVYFLIRMSETFTSGMESFLLFLSMLTMFMAGLAANLEYDLKKIIALSTLSQLGLMMTILSLGDSDLAYMHLLIHALFKALLFMCAGAIIHNLGDVQDIRMMGGLVNYLPLTCACMNISNFALCGLPFMSGFYSKDLIAEVVSMDFSSLLVYFIFYFSIGLTASYSFRLSYFIFWSEAKFMCLSGFSDQNNSQMLKSMFSLVILVVFMGSIYSWVTFSAPYFVFLPSSMKILTLGFIILGVLLGNEISSLEFFYSNFYLNYIKIVLFFVNMWNLPLISTAGLNKHVLLVGKLMYNTFDHGWLEYYGSKGLFSVVEKFMLEVQSVFVNNHLKLIFLLFTIYLSGVLIFIGWSVF
uniref:NADH-ubiquinone oxidoreductase chain 5 n=1 Tax=Orthotomicus laricis TaxID=102854 RepID=A0A2D0VPW7_9CUCU|nr:NADH dehydrogenase subunit 5 [Orthotomicus laricis]AOY40196.1 NADH dehydrogenase subunit 5 [Orthotomicus laricis]